MCAAPTALAVLAARLILNLFPCLSASLKFSSKSLQNVYGGNVPGYRKECIMYALFNSDTQKLALLVKTLALLHPPTRI